MKARDIFKMKAEDRQPVAKSVPGDHAERKYLKDIRTEKRCAQIVVKVVGDVVTRIAGKGAEGVARSFGQREISGHEYTANSIGNIKSDLGRWFGIQVSGARFGFAAAARASRSIRAWAQTDGETSEMVFEVADFSVAVRKSFRVTAFPTIG